MQVSPFQSFVRETYLSSQQLVKTELARRFRAAPEEIDDCLQEATLKFTRYMIEDDRWSRFIDRPSHSRSLLLVMAVQVAVDSWRQKHTRTRDARWLSFDEQNPEKPEDNVFPDPLSHCIDGEQRSQFVRAIESIKQESARRVAHLHFIEGQGVHEIAERLGMKTNTVLSHIARTKVCISKTMACRTVGTRAMKLRARPRPSGIPAVRARQLEMALV